MCVLIKVFSIQLSLDQVISTRSFLCTILSLGIWRSRSRSLISKKLPSAQEHVYGNTVNQWPLDIMVKAKDDHTVPDSSMYLPPSLFSIVLWDRDYPHFTDTETEARKVK